MTPEAMILSSTGCGETTRMPAAAEDTVKIDKMKDDIKNLHLVLDVFFMAASPCCTWRLIHQPKKNGGQCAPSNFLTKPTEFN
jgi:hypothetical protein